MRNEDDSLMVRLFREDFNCTFFEMKLCNEKKKTTDDNLITEAAGFFRFLAYGIQVEGIEIPGASSLWSSLIKVAAF